MRLRIDKVESVKRGESILSYQPRRPVPWGIGDVILAMGTYVAMPACIVLLMPRWRPMGAVVPLPVDEGGIDAAHPLARVLTQSPSGWVILVCVLSAVVIAPVIEELLFRLLLQGWLESVERRLRRRIPRLRFATPGVMAVMTSSLLFAALHFRQPSLEVDMEMLFFQIFVGAVANLLTALLVLCWLRIAAGATLADFGVVPRKLAADVKLGMLAFLVITVPVYAVVIAMKNLLPDNVVADPIPLFLLAMVLGGLYCRTHRIVPAIVLHMAFNATGVILALWAS